MATTAEGAALTEQHRQQQIRNAAATALLVNQLWDGINWTDASIALARFLLLATPHIDLGRRKSALIAVNYAERFRVTELGSIYPRPSGAPSRNFEPMADVPEAKLRASLGAVGLAPATKIAAKRGVIDSPDVERKLLSNLKALREPVKGAVIRHVGDGGRETIRSIVQSQDKQAIGYVRVTRTKPCYFCAMLASRGPVYDNDSFDDSDPRFIGPGTAKVHDHCHCTLEPVYSRKTNWPGNARKFEEIWLESDGTLNGFRKVYAASGAL